MLNTFFMNKQIGIITLNDRSETAIHSRLIKLPLYDFDAFSFPRLTSMSLLFLDNRPMSRISGAL